MNSEHKFIFWGCFDFGENRYWNFPWRILHGWLVFLFHDVRRKICLTRRLTSYRKRWSICGIAGCRERTSRSGDLAPALGSSCFMGDTSVPPRGPSNLAKSLGRDADGGVEMLMVVWYHVGLWKQVLGFLISSQVHRSVLQIWPVSADWGLLMLICRNLRLRTRLDSKGDKVGLLLSSLSIVHYLCLSKTLY